MRTVYREPLVVNYCDPKYNLSKKKQMEYTEKDPLIGVKMKVQRPFDGQDRRFGTNFSTGVYSVNLTEDSEHPSPSVNPNTVYYEDQRSRL